MTVWQAVEHLIAYGIRQDLITPADSVYARNRILDAIGMSAPQHTGELTGNPPLEEILRVLLDDACGRDVIENRIGERDLLDTRIMGCLVPFPAAVQARFGSLYAQSPDKATDWFYAFCQDCDYIRRYRIARDIRWTTPSEYGEMEISINLAKPEKDPRDIAAAKNATGSTYPQCALCLENEGYAGRSDFPARQTLRLVPVELVGERFGFQYSPYVYYNEHCIVINQRHIPMQINRDSFARLLSFVKQFPHYFIGSNADLPIVGGSILSHDHFQGGRHELPMARAVAEWGFAVRGYPNVEASVLKWPLSVIRLRSSRESELIELGTRILEKWRGYSDESAGIFASTDNEPHNTITPVARQRAGVFELDLALRNNRATSDHPSGVFHPHAELHHIKSENIGVIEVMGLAILPPRLKKELAAIADILKKGGDLRDNPLTGKHAAWVRGFLHRVPGSGTLEPVLYEEIGKVFVKVLECCGVFKRTAQGKEAFVRFVQGL